MSVSLPNSKLHQLMELLLAPQAKPGTNTKTSFLLDEMAKANAGLEWGPDGDATGDPNQYPLQQCDPSGQIPTAQEGKWCLWNWYDESKASKAKKALGVGDPFHKMNPQHPMNNICLRRLPADFCEKSRHKDILPHGYKHGFIKGERPFWQPDKRDEKMTLTPQTNPFRRPQGRGYKIMEKSRLLWGSLSRKNPMVTRWRDNTDISLYQKIKMWNQEWNDNVESGVLMDAEGGVVKKQRQLPFKSDPNPSKGIGGASKSEAPDRPKFNMETDVTKLDDQWVSPLPGPAMKKKMKWGMNKIAWMKDPTKRKGLLKKAKQASKLWGMGSAGYDPEVVLDEGEECCGNGCAQHINRPYCVTEWEIRRYFENSERILPWDLINCSWSDSKICDSLHGDARDQDDHWGDGWLNAMRRWNNTQGPLDSPDLRWQERIGKFQNQEDPPDYFPPNYSPTANTTSYAVYSVTPNMGNPGSQNLPPAYHSDPINEGVSNLDEALGKM